MRALIVRLYWLLLLAWAFRLSRRRLRVVIRVRFGGERHEMSVANDEWPVARALLQELGDRVEAIRLEAIP
jgi:hypothetical protein